MNKLIRNIPDDTAQLLQEQAKALGLTLEAYIRLKLIEVAKRQQAVGKGSKIMDMQEICDAMKKDGVAIDAHSLCDYIEKHYSTLWAQLGDYPYGEVAAWLDRNPQ